MEKANRNTTCVVYCVVIKSKQNKREEKLNGKIK